MKIVKVMNTPMFNVALVEDQGQVFLKASSSVYPAIERLPVEDLVQMAEFIEELRQDQQPAKERPEAETPKKKS